MTWILKYLGKISVTMEFLSGKVVIFIIACVSVIIINSIVISIAVIFSGGESKSPLTTTTKITTTTVEGKSNPSKLYAVWVFAKKFLQPTVCPLLTEFL